MGVSHSVALVLYFLPCEVSTVAGGLVLRTLFYHSKMQYKKARAEVPPRKFKKCRRFYPKIGLANYIAVHVRLVGHRRHGLRTPNIFG